LRSLGLGGTQVSDLAPLASLTALQHLDLGGTQVRDLTPLARLTALETLDLIGTQVSNLTPLAGLIALQTLSLDDTQVSDLAPLARVTRLQDVVASMRGRGSGLSYGGTPASKTSRFDRFVQLEELPAPSGHQRDPAAAGSPDIGGLRAAGGPAAATST
jgi:Leucine-rich repeat (LRR) protein